MGLNAEATGSKVARLDVNPCCRNKTWGRAFKFQHPVPDQECLKAISLRIDSNEDSHRSHFDSCWRADIFACRPHRKVVPLNPSTTEPAPLSVPETRPFVVSGRMFAVAGSACVAMKKTAAAIACLKRVPLSERPLIGGVQSSSAGDERLQWENGL